MSNAESLHGDPVPKGELVNKIGLLPVLACPHIFAALADAQLARRISDDCLFYEERFCPLYRHRDLKAALPDATLAERIYTLYQLIYAGAIEIVQEIEDGWYLFPTDQILPYAEDIKHSDRKDSKPGFVYLLEGGGYYKIGKSIDVNRRLTEIVMPFDVKIVHFLAYDDMSEGERIWHQHFADKRGNGEWFRLTPEDVEQFCVCRSITALATKLLLRFQATQLKNPAPNLEWWFAFKAQKMDEEE